MERQLGVSGSTTITMKAAMSAIGQEGERTATALDAHNLKVEGIESVVLELRGAGQWTLAAVTQTQADVKQLQTDARRTLGRPDHGFGTNYETRWPGAFWASTLGLGTPGA